MSPEFNKIFQTKFLFNKIVLDCLRILLNIHPNEGIEDLFDDLLEFIPIYVLQSLEILSHKKGSDSHTKRTKMNISLFRRGSRKMVNSNKLSLKNEYEMDINKQRV